MPIWPRLPLLRQGMKFVDGPLANDSDGAYGDGVIEIDPEGPKPTSYSSLRSWLSCQKRWQLLKVEHVDRSPGWNLVGGSAVHLLTQWWENAYTGGVA